MKIKGRVVIIRDNGERIKIKGKGSFDEDIFLQKLTGDGNVVLENQAIDKIRFKGILKGEDLKCKSLELQGSIVLNKIETNIMDVAFSGNSKLNLLCGEIIKIKPEKNQNPEVIADFFGKLLHTKFKTPDLPEGKFCIDEIIADIVDLEGIEAKMISCKEAIIGPGCKVKKLLYNNSCKVSKESSVDIIIKQAIENN